MAVLDYQKQEEGDPIESVTNKSNSLLNCHEKKRSNKSERRLKNFKCKQNFRKSQYFINETKGRHSLQGSSTSSPPLRDCESPFLISSGESSLSSASDDRESE